MRNANERKAPRRGRVSEGIAARIKKDVSEGRLTPGSRLPPERQLAQRFNTSRVSVREAYRSLEELGLLSIRRGAEGGAFIAEVGHEPVSRSLSLMLRMGKTSHEELTQARLLLEPSVARLAAEHASPEDIEQLRLLLRKQEEAIEGKEDPRRYDLQFHRLVSQCAQNLPLKIVMNALAYLTVEAISSIDLSRDLQRHVVLFHRRIFDAISRHDGEAAHQVMLRHVLDVQSRLRRTFLNQINKRRARVASR